MELKLIIVIVILDQSVCFFLFHLLSTILLLSDKKICISLSFDKMLTDIFSIIYSLYKYKNVIQMYCPAANV